MTDNRPIPIKKACDVVFAGEIGPDAFRSWAKGAGVRIIRVGRKDFVVPQQCLDALDRPVSSSTNPEEHGSFATEPSASEQAQALNAKLRIVSRDTSRGNSSQSRTPARSSVRSS
jgi:hypothetical protein